MKIAYLSYWGINDGLTRSTVIPHVEILSSFNEISRIYLFTIERTDIGNNPIDDDKVQHIPLTSKFKSLRLINKIFDFIWFPNQIKFFVKANKIDLLVCRGAPAGAIGLLAMKNSKIPFIVESFEPHAAYMLESGVWSKYSLSYNLEKMWEEKIKYKANFVLPVSSNFQEKLLKQGIKAKVIFAPCAVNSVEFEFDNSIRNNMREDLKIEDHQIVGIYVGKFGDIYLKEEFFEILKSLKSQLKEKFHFIILSPQNPKEIYNFLRDANIDRDLVNVLSVKHEEVSNYLSASDYGLVTVQPSPHRKYCSPIKTGEYWANGLPILITEGIGDDSAIIKENDIGEIVSLNEIDISVKDFIQKLNSKGRAEWATIIMPIAKKFRSFDFINKAYSEILKDIEKG